MTSFEQIFIDSALSQGADAAASIDVSDISFDPSFRKACEQNFCGHYGKCWTCPPHVGEVDSLIARVQGYRRAIVMQTVSELEDSYDFEGMEEAGAKHTALSAMLFDELLTHLQGPALRLGVGACTLCQPCAITEDRPCRFPDRAIASLEAHCISVSKLAGKSGMKYINGENTVTYFSLFLY